MNASPAPAAAISPLAIPDFRAFWATRIAATLAQTGMTIVIGYQFYDIARSAGLGIEAASFRLGLIGLAQFLPLFLLTPIAGVVADRGDRRTIVAAALALDLLLAVVLALVTGAGAIGLGVLYGIAAVHGVARAFQGPAQSAIIANVVPPEVLPRAVAFGSTAWQAGTIIGPAAAGLLFARLPALPYWAAAALLAVAIASLMLIALNLRALFSSLSALLPEVMRGTGASPAIASLMTMRRLPSPAANRDVHPLHQITDGFRYVIAHRFLLGCTTLDLFAVLLGGATALLPVYARDILHVGAAGLGPMRAAPAVGAVVTGLILSARPLARAVGTRMLWAVAVFGAATVAFGLSRSYPLSLAILAVLGAADMVSVFIRNSLVQLHTPDNRRGRVSAVTGLAISASNELGEMESGVAAGLLGPVMAVVLGGVAAVAITAIWAVLFPEIRRATTFARPADVIAAEDEMLKEETAI